MADKQSKNFIDKLKTIFSTSSTKNAKAAMLTPYKDTTTKDKEKKPKDENQKLKNKFGF